MITRAACIRCASVCLFFLTFLVGSTLFAQSVSDRPSAREYLAREQEIRAREAEAKVVRMRVLEREQELTAVTREAARSEREKIEDRIKALQVQVEQKRWALSQFEVRERGLIPGLPEPSKPQQQTQAYNGRRRVRIPETSGVPTQMQRWQRVRDLSKQQFLAYPEQSRGAIKSGRALNFFLDVCGPTALDHQLYREELGTTSDILKLGEHTPTPDRGKKIEEAQKRHSYNLGLLDKDPQSLNVRRALVDELRGPQLFSREDLSQVTVEKGAIGYKLKSHLNDEPLALDWPDEVKSNGKYASHVKAIEEAKQQALDCLKSHKAVPLDLQRTLMAEADAMCSLCEANARQYFAESRQSLKSGREPPPAARGRDLVVARRFIQELRGGVARFLAARDYRDVATAEFPPPGQERASVDDVLAFMCRHGIRFGQADTNGESVYQQIFQQMAKYYVDLYALQVALEDEDRQVKRSEEDVARLMKTQYDKFKDPTAQGPQFHLGLSSRGGLEFGISGPLSE